MLGALLGLRRPVSKLYYLKFLMGLLSEEKFAHMQKRGLGLTASRFQAFVHMLEVAFVRDELLWFHAFVFRVRPPYNYLDSVLLCSNRLIHTC
jgi:hypothetical protein